MNSVGVLMTFYAHSGLASDRSDWQLLPEHLENVAFLASRRGTRLNLAACARVAGLFHDLGKYDPEFDRRLRNENVRVDHATAGGKMLMDDVPPGLSPVAEALAYAILGHHAGLPDRINESDACMDVRLSSFKSALDPAWRAHQPVDFEPLAREIKGLVRPGPKAAFDFSVSVRMIFSCLVDADYRDTETYYGKLNGQAKDRDWAVLAEVLPDLKAKFDAYIGSLPSGGSLNQIRSDILRQVRGKATLPPGLFTLCVPTGGGKTLASLGFALDHAALHGHRRVIYAIPYTSIIDQTVRVFEEVLGDGIVLEHHSAIDDDKCDFEGRDKLRLAMEDWSAPVIVTTNVQLFESLFAARPSRCRKVHNIAGSVIILDEVHCLPRKVLLPTLAMIDTLAAHYGCTIVLCTATQPAFDSAELKQGGLEFADRELAPDPVCLAQTLRRATICDGGIMSDAALVEALAGTPQGLVIVNSRKHALDLFGAAQEAGLDGMVHLTTRQCPMDRRGILDDVRRRLREGLPCRLIATSLVEAGVDLDFPVGWRAAAGLDSVIQAAGRVNREGERPPKTSTLTVFEAPDNPPPAEVQKLAQAMQATASSFDDLLAPDAIRDWFHEVYWSLAPKALGADMMGKVLLSGAGTNFAFRTLADEYRMIETTMVPVIIPLDDVARNAVASLTMKHISSGVLARALQPYIVQIPRAARGLLRENGKGDFVAHDLRADQFFQLTSMDLYRPDVGLLWEDADFLAADQAMI